MNKLLYLILSASITLGTSSIAYPKDYKSKATPNGIIYSQDALKQNYTIKTKKLNHKNNMVDIQLNIPIVENFKNASLQCNINKTIENTIMNKQKQIKNISMEDKKNNALINNPYILITNFKVASNTNNILSIVLNFYEYTGGAHGISYNESINIDITTGKQITMKDLLSDHKNLKSMLNKLVIDTINKNPNEYFELKHSNFHGIENNQPFYIENGNIVLFFNPYEIAPYASGIKEFKFPLKNLK